MAIRRIKAFFEFEAAGGIVLALAAIAAMIIANSPLNVWYEGFIHAPVAIQIGEFAIAKDAHHWINDGLMAVFFFLVGLELKREVLIGELSNVKQIILPAGAALGGMIMPAIVYLLFNYNEPEFPAATDIAFALGILSLLGNRVPNSLKVFLVSIAIFDDIGAILIIALFYTSELSLESLAVAGLCLPFLYVLNRRNVTNITPYLLIGLIMWIAVLKSGIHATLAIYGAALLCGVGFTMSLFIGGLAFAGDTTMFDERLGIIMGSIVSGIAGYIMLKMSLKDNASGTSVDLTRPH